MAEQVRTISTSASLQTWTPTGTAGAAILAVDDGSYVESLAVDNTASGTLSLASPFSVPTGSIINSLNVRIKVRLAAAGSRTMRAGFSGAMMAATQNLTSTDWTYMDFPFAADPATSSAWTAESINALTTAYIRAYADADGPIVQADYIAIVVDYAEGSGGEGGEPVPGVVSIYSGSSTPISKIYSGTTLIWSDGSSEPPPGDPPETLDLATYNLALSKRTVFGHQSVGYQVLQGVNMWADEFGVPDPTLYDVESATLPSTGGFISHFYAGTNGDPFSKMNEFLDHLANGLADEVDIVVLKFCYADLRTGSGHTAQQMFDAYKAWVDEIESTYPALTIIYATEAIVMGENSDGSNNGVRQTFNNLVRAEYAASGRLWDVADIESTDPDGNKVLYGGIESLYSGYASPDQRHIYGLGRTTVAAGFLQMIASIE